MEILVNKKTALVFGASGLVGSQLTQQLLDHPAYTTVRIFVRHQLDITHPKLDQQLIDFNNPVSFEDHIKGNDLFLCLGTTMAKAGSREAFYKVDFTYAYQAAQAAVNNGVNQLLLVSAVGADSNSLFYYSRVKGELEEAVKKLPFWAIHILQPSVLLGDRKENRIGERIGARLSLGAHRLSGGRLGKYEPVEAAVVAGAMIQSAQQLQSGQFTIPSHELKFLADASGLPEKIR
ncbi:MAG: NAD(P)H-binding protein [Saprospiraceae bacterium]|nr:NAD(P)H-binding protein [Saprospiraceae bacterium]